VIRDPSSALSSLAATIRTTMTVFCDDDVNSPVTGNA